MSKILQFSKKLQIFLSNYYSYSLWLNCQLLEFSVENGEYHPPMLQKLPAAPKKRRKAANKRHTQEVNDDTDYVASQSRVSFCAPGLGPTLRQGHKMSQIFAENEWILRVATEVESFFIGLFSKEKDLWFFGRAPLAQLKKPSQKVKIVLFRGNER